MNLPPNAERVFSGIIFDVYHWEQEMFDGTTATFERLKRPDTVAVIAVLDGMIVILDDEQPDRGVKTTIPGGRMDPGEVPLDAAKRELLEETGMASDDWELFDTYAPVPKIDWNVHYFIARNARKAAQQHPDAGERIAVRTVSFDEFIELASSKKFSSGDFTADILRMRLEPAKLETFRKRLAIQDSK